MDKHLATDSRSPFFMRDHGLASEHTHYLINEFRPRYKVGRIRFRVSLARQQMLEIGGSKKTTPVLRPYAALGYRHDGGWRVYVSGVVWQTPIHFNLRQRMLIRMLGGVMQATPQQLQSEVFLSRIGPFMAEPETRRTIILTINGNSRRLRKRTRRNGRFSEAIMLTNQDVEQAQLDSFGNRTLEFSIALEDDSADPQTGLIHLQTSGGISVVSDIDDTIKDSVVADRRELLANTFLRPFRGIDGMASVYQHWQSMGTSFHYVSSSPWQLYDSLQQLHGSLDFPIGTMHLRNFRLRDQFLKRILIRRGGKASAIRALVKLMPGRQFVLVGDSGEKDAKIYRKIAQKYPDRVKGVFIRDLTNRPLSDKRLRKLKTAVTGGICSRFSTAEELKIRADRIFQHQTSNNAPLVEQFEQ